MLLAAAFLIVTINALVFRFVSLRFPFTAISAYLVVEMVAVWPAFSRFDGAENFPTNRAAALVILSAGSVMLGFYMANGIRDPKPIAATFLPSKNLRTAVVVTVLVLFAFQIYAHNGIPPYGPAVRSMFTGDGESRVILRDTRQVLTKGQLIGVAYRGQGVIKILTETGWQLVIGTIGASYGFRKPLFSLPASAALVTFGVLNISTNGVRAAVIGLAAAGLLAFASVRKISLSRRATIAVFGAAFLLLIIPLSKSAQQSSGLADRAAAVVGRVSSGNGDHDADILILLETGELEQQNGAIFAEKTAAMVPGVTAGNGEPFALRLTRMIYDVSETNTSYSTPTQLGLLVADGGNAGVVVGYFLTGIVIAVSWRIVYKLAMDDDKRLTAVDAALLAVVTYQSSQYAIGGIQAFVVPVGVAVLYRWAWRRATLKRAVTKRAVAVQHA